MLKPRPPPAQTWAAYDLAADNNSWTVTVPSNLASGNYVFRHEIIAVHGASSLDGAQNYPQCVNIAVTGGGSASPSGTLGTALYSETDPGIYFNPYVNLENYTIPGPALMSGASTHAVTATSGGAGTAAATTAASSSSSSSSAAAAAATTSSSVQTAAAVATETWSVATSAAPAATATATATEESSCGSKRRRRHARDVSA